MSTSVTITKIRLKPIDAESPSLDLLEREAAARDKLDYVAGHIDSVASVNGNAVFFPRIEGNEIHFYLQSQRGQEYCFPVRDADIEIFDGQQPETPELSEVYFYIEAGYIWGFGMSEEQISRWAAEIRELFSAHGFTIEECKHATNCPYVIKGHTRLYCHPQELAGVCQVSHISEIEAILHKGTTFRFTESKRFGRVYDFTPGQEADYYQSKEPDIRQSLLRAFGTDSRQVYKYRTEILELVIQKFRIHTLLNKNCPDCITQAATAVRRVYDQLVSEGALEEAPIQVGNTTGPGCRVPIHKTE